MKGMDVPGSAGKLTGSFAALANWVEALHGASGVAGALEDLTKLVRADAAILVRQIDNAEWPTVIAIADLKRGKLLSADRRTFFRTVTGDDFPRLQPGRVLTYRELVADGAVDSAHAASIENRLLRHEVRDFAIVPLDSRDGGTDFLELQFSNTIAKHNADLLAIMAASISDAWSSRNPGTAEIARVHHRKLKPVDPEPDDRIPILDVSNPLSLSRCEYRVCALVKEGMLVRDIAEMLQVRASTVRSHLRSIYQKAEVGCQVELLYRLYSETEVQSSAEQMKSMRLA